MYFITICAKAWGPISSRLERNKLWWGLYQEEERGTLGMLGGKRLERMLVSRYFYAVIMFPFGSKGEKGISFDKL